MLELARADSRGDAEGGGGVAQALAAATHAPLSAQPGNSKSFTEAEDMSVQLGVTTS